MGPVANATIQKLPTGATPPYIGTSIAITADWWIPGTEHVGAGQGGGAFAGTVSPGGASPTVNTAFWCVDDQTYFSPSTTPGPLANITLLSDLSSAPGLNQTEYSTANGTFTLTNDPIGNAAIAQDPQTRLLMAAYLITQYGGYNTGGGSFSQTPITGNQATNDDIQNAIWAITNNTAFTGANGHTGPGNHSTSDAGVQYWINQAFLNYASVSQTSWALVTWQVNGGGTVTNPQQNFLVAVQTPGNDTSTPEPGFYGVLALALSSLTLVVSRKRKSA